MGTGGRVVMTVGFLMSAMVLSALVFWVTLFAGENKPPTREQRTQFVQGLRDEYDLPLPKETEVVEYEDRSERDMETWALLRVQPEAVAGIRRALLRFAAKHTERVTLDDNDAREADVVRGTRKQDLPPWWKPGELADGDVMVIRREGGVFVVLSAKRGLIYVLRWDV